MRPFLLILTASFFVTSLAKAQLFPVGARSTGMGYASVTNIDLWATFNNQAALAFLEKTEVGVFAENRFLMDEMMTQAFAVAVPVKNVGTISASFYRFGFALYNDNKYAVAYSRTFGERFSAAMQFNVFHTQFGDVYGSRVNFNPELSIFTKVSEKITLGTHLLNPTRTRFLDFADERMPTILRIGLGYQWSKEFLSNIEFYKDINFPVSLRVGGEYGINEQVWLRGGFSTGATYGTFGVGVNLKGAKADIATAYHQILGFIPQLALSYTFQ